jgi:hypothetical protein
MLQSARSGQALEALVQVTAIHLTRLWAHVLKGPPQIDALGCEASKAAYSLPAICAQHIEFERALLAPQRQSGGPRFGHPVGERDDPAPARLPRRALGGRPSSARFALVQIVNAARRIPGQAVCVERRRAMRAIAAKPNAIIDQVAGSGTAGPMDGRVYA